jgi:hypothetical protein
VHVPVTKQGDAFIMPDNRSFPTLDALVNFYRFNNVSDVHAFTLSYVEALCLMGDAHGV